MEELMFVCTVTAATVLCLTHQAYADEIRGKINEMVGLPPLDPAPIVFRDPEPPEPEVVFTGRIDPDNLLKAVKKASKNRKKRYVVVRDSPGGRVDGAALAYRLAKHEGVTFRIEERCYSACVMLLGVPGTCLKEKTAVGVHAARILGGNYSRHWTTVVRNHYPPKLREAIKEIDYREDVFMHYLSDKTLRDAGIPRCD